MSADQARTKRLLDVTRELETAARARLAAMQADASAIAQAHERLVAALDTDHPLHGLFTAAIGRRLAALASDERKLAAAQAAHAQEFVDWQGRRRQCERMLDAAVGVTRRNEEARELDEIVARLARQRVASPG